MAHPGNGGICIDCGVNPVKKSSSGNNRSYCPECVRYRHRLRKYGITREQYDAMDEEQRGLCALCEEDFHQVVDHDHETGKVRALLCTRCNVLIGFLESFGHLLPEAMKYLSVHKKATG